MLGDFPKNSDISELTTPPLTRLTNSSKRHFVAAIVRPWQSSPLRKPDEVYGDQLNTLSKAGDHKIQHWSINPA